MRILIRSFFTSFRFLLPSDFFLLSPVLCALHTLCCVGIGIVLVVVLHMNLFSVTQVRTRFTHINIPRNALFSLFSSSSSHKHRSSLPPAPTASTPASQAYPASQPITTFSPQDSSFTHKKCSPLASSRSLSPWSPPSDSLA